MSVVYATGLISGNTYYVQVGTYGSSTTTGTFCMTVDEMNSLMLALTATCASTPQSPYLEPIQLTQDGFQFWMHQVNLLLWLKILQAHLLGLILTLIKTSTREQ
ncbi:MAG: hypothetical protein IPN87_14675 [Saprospiraceae bacterium]|nr:hypothetical protein [Candidatus Brachybacter algidus]